MLFKSLVSSAYLCALILLTTINIASADVNGYWIKPDPITSQALNIPEGSTQTLTGKICAVKRVGNKLECGTIKDKSIQLYGSFPDASQDISSALMLQKNADGWSYRFTTPPLTKDQNNQLTLIVGKPDKSIHKLLKTKTKFERLITKVEQKINALDPRKKNYAHELQKWQNKHALLNQVIDELENRIDGDPKILTRATFPLMVADSTHGKLTHTAQFQHYSLNLEADRGVYKTGETAQLTGSITLQRPIHHYPQRSGRLSILQNGTILAEVQVEKLLKGVPVTINALIPNLNSSNSYPLELSFYNFKDKLRVSLPLNLAISTGASIPQPLARLAVNHTEAKVAENFTFDASASTAGVGTIIDYTLDFGDGSIESSSTPIFSHSYTQEGEYTVRLTVTDSNLSKAQTSLKVMVKPLPLTQGPLANFTYRLLPDSNEVVLFYQARPGDAPITSARYTTSTGLSADVPELVWRRQVTLPVVSPFNMSVTLTVRDQNGKTNSFTHTLNPESTPIVHMYWKDLGARQAFFDFRDSFDSIDEIAGFEISYGDGQVEELDFITKLTSHTYAEAGTYSVTLTAWNYDDVSVSKTYQVTVSELILPITPPVASFEVAFPSNSNNVSFYINLSLGLSGSIVSAHWDYGDGTSYQGLEPIHAHFYGPGAYLATLTITDSYGNVSSQTQRIIIEDDGAPFIAGIFCNPTASVGEISCESYVYDRDKEISQINIAWGDGSSQEIPVTNPEWMFILETIHQYQYAGTYNYTMTVTTTRGEQVTSDGLVTVQGETRNLPPVANVHCSTQDLTVICDASMSYDPDGFITQYSWDMGDGTQIMGGIFITHTYAQVGTYQVSSKIIDNLGSETNKDLLVSVTRVSNPPTLTADCISDQKFKISCSANATPDLGEIVSYQWILSDGTVLSGQNISHIFADGGTKSITVTVTDTNTLATTKNIQVSVLNEDPYVLAEFHCDDSYPLKLNCTSFSSSTNMGRIESYSWNLNNNLVSTRGSEIFEFTSAQEVVVSLTVTNSSGNSHSLQKTFQVKGLEDSPYAKGTISLADYPQTEFKRLDSELIFNVNGVELTRSLNEETGETDSNFRLSINDELQSDSAIDIAGTELTFKGGLVDGVNRIILEVTDPSGKVLVDYFNIYAGARTIIVNTEGARQGILKVNYGLQDNLEKVEFALTSENNFFEIKNAPMNDILIIAQDTEQRVGAKRVRSNENELTIEFKNLAIASLLNNDFTDGTSGWIAPKGTLRTSTEVDPFNPGEMKTVLVIEPNADGEAELFKSIAAAPGHNEVVFNFKTQGVSKDDYYIVILKTRQSNKVSYESISFDDMGIDPLSTTNATIGLRDIRVNVEGPTDIVDVYLYKKTHLTTSTWIKKRFDKIFDPFRAYAQEAGSGNTTIHTLETAITFFTTIQLGDSRISPPKEDPVYRNYLSTGFYHPYESFSTLKNGERIGVNNLVFKQIIIPDYSIEYDEMLLEVYDITSDKLINRIPLNESAKIIIEGSTKFKLRNNLLNQLAFQIESNQIVTNANQLNLRIYARDGITQYRRSVGTPINLVSMLPYFISSAANVSPEEEAEYEKLRYGSNADIDFTRDHAVGGDDYVLPQVATPLRDLLNGRYFLGTQEVKLLFNDATCQNGGLYSQRTTSHFSGSHIDLNFINASLANIDRVEKINRVIINDNTFSAWSEELADLLLSLVSPIVEKIILTYRPFQQGVHDINLTSNLASKLYSTCLDDGRPGERVIASDINIKNPIHYNHIHLEYQRNNNNSSIRNADLFAMPSTSSPYLTHDNNDLGTYHIKNTEESVSYRWFFMGDETLLPGSTPSKIYPIEFLPSSIIQYNPNQKTITVGEFRSGFPIRLAVMAVRLSNLNKPISCRMHQNVKLELPADFKRTILLTQVRNMYGHQYNGLIPDENNQIDLLFLKPTCTGGDNFRIYNTSLGGGYGGQLIYRKATSTTSIPIFDFYAPSAIPELEVYTTTTNRKSLLSGNLMYGDYVHNNTQRKLYLFIPKNTCRRIAVEHTQISTEDSVLYPSGMEFNVSFGEYTDITIPEE